MFSLHAVTALSLAFHTTVTPSDSYKGAPIGR